MMKDGTCNAKTLSISTAKSCYRCGKTDHGAAICNFKAAKCRACQKIGHIARVCRAKNKNNQVTKTDSKQAKVDMKKSKDEVHQIETVPSKTGLRGADDFKRKQGTPGIRDPKGLAGSTGNTGAHGPTGPAGATGLPNARGPHGRSGAEDAPGPGGSTGATGDQFGPDELVGPVGNPGVQGTLGTKGKKEPTSGKVQDGPPGGSGQSSLLSQKGIRVDCGSLGVVGEQRTFIPIEPQGTQDQPGATEGAGLKGIRGTVGQTEYQGATDATEHKMLAMYLLILCRPY